MIVYITGTALSIIFAYISTHISKSHEVNNSSAAVIKSLFAFLSFLPLAVISMIRFNVGIDFMEYRNIYITLDKASQFYASKGFFGENGFILLFRVLKYFSDNPQLFFIVTSIFICGSYYILIYKESVSPAYSALLFVICKDFFLSLTGIRQYIAISIAIYSLPLIKRKKWIPTIVILLIAATFHTSVLVFILIYIMNLINIKPLTGWGIVVITAAASRSILRLMIPLLRQFNLYYRYFARGLDTYNSTGNAALEVLLISLSFYILLCYEYNSAKHSENFKLLYNAVLYSLIISVMTPVLPMSSYRLTWYMNVFIVLYLPEALQLMPSKKLRQIASFFVIMAFFGVIIYILYINPRLHFLPYQTIWSQ